MKIGAPNCRKRIDAGRIKGLYSLTFRMKVACLVRRVQAH
ncbi:unnamed protein product, partial [Brassica oleracea var. botrytis]